MFRPILLVALTVVLCVTASTPHHHSHHHHHHHHHHHSSHHDTSSLPSTLSIRIALRHRNWDLFQTHFERITDIHDDMYGKWMTIEEMSEMIGITKQDEGSVRHMLRDLGATNIHLSSSRDFISCDLPTTVARHMIDDISNAHQLYAHVSRTHHDAIKHISFVWRTPTPSTGTYKKHHTPRKAHYVGFDKYQARLDEINNKIRAGHHQLAAEMLTDDPTSGTPQNQWAAYGVPAATRGSNSNNSQLVWGTGTYGYTASDLSSYYSTYNIQDEDRFVLSNGPYQPAYPGVPGGDNFGEGTLDVTLITGLAPGILTVVSNTDNSTSSEEGYGFGPALLNFVTYLASNPTIPNVISMSLGSLSWDSCNILCTQVSLNGQNITYQQCVDYMQQQRQVCMYPDAAGIDRINDEFQKLGARGITLLAATGDGGSHFSFQRFNIFDPIGAALNTVSCAFNFPTFPAASPWVLGVGGVDWSQGGYTNPQPWVASGSGFSWRFPQPSYQKDFVQNYLKSTANLPPASAFNASNRAYPDVAALATNVPIVMEGSLTASGGTSASTPAFAALISLINDARLNANLPPLGFVNPRLYDIARKSYAEAFVDLTTGSSACDSAGFCCSSGFPAATGWDPTTGLGSPLFSGLLKHLGTDN